jgi:hypothetical protein
MSKFYERRHNPQKDEKYTNYAMAYYRKELEESNQYLVTPQERENMVALATEQTQGTGTLVSFSSKLRNALVSLSRITKFLVDMRLLSVGSSMLNPRIISPSSTRYPSIVSSISTLCYRFY